MEVIAEVQNQILQKSIRYLLDGNDNEAVSLLLASSIEWKIEQEFQQYGEDDYGFHGEYLVTLVMKLNLPRRGYEAVKKGTELRIKIEEAFSLAAELIDLHFEADDEFPVVLSNRLDTGILLLGIGVWKPYRL